jgi:hypothetical protein
MNLSYPLYSILFSQIHITDLHDPNTKYVAVCNKWLAKDEDDGLISRDLMLNKEGGATSGPIGGTKRSKKKNFREFFFNDLAYYL